MGPNRFKCWMKIHVVVALLLTEVSIDVDAFVTGRKSILPAFPSVRVVSFTHMVSASDETDLLITDGSSSKSWTPNLSKDASTNSDNLDKYAADIATCLKVLRPGERDPTIPAPFRTVRLSFTNIWTLDMWKRYTSRWRFLRCILDLPKSRLLRRIFPQLTVLLLWSICAVNMSSRNVLGLHRISIPFSSLSLVSTFAAALETLRSNQGLARLNEGRLAWGRAVLLSRDTAYLLNTYIYSKDKELGLLSARYLSLFGWLLRGHNRGTDDDDDIVRTMLPSPIDANYVLEQRKKPTAVIARLRQVISEISDRDMLKNSPHAILEKHLADLDEVLMKCERLRGSPIPALYTSHATRLLMVYLFFLPLALHGLMPLQNSLTVLVTGLVGFALLGLDEISHILEQPFRLMPLWQLSKMVMDDVADAFVCQPPPLPSTTTNGGTTYNYENATPSDTTGNRKPAYWR